MITSKSKLHHIPYNDLSVFNNGLLNNCSNRQYCRIGLIDYRGKLQATTAQFELAVLNGKVGPRQGMTFYVQWNHWPLLILALFMLLVWAYYRKNDLNKQAG